jgi:hypothetical protein
LLVEKQPRHGTADNGEFSLEASEDLANLD